MASVIIEDELEPELQPRHRRQVVVWAALTHLGLLLMCASAVYTLQPPTFGMKRWAGFALLALVLLVSAAATRGRSASQQWGRLLTGLAAGIVLMLAGEPQLANLGSLGDRMPDWLMGMYLSVGTIGLAVAVIAGLVYLRTISAYLGSQQETRFRWAVGVSAALVVVLAVVTYVTLDRLYEMDIMHLALLLGSTVQYGLLFLVVPGLTGRVGVGASMQVYFAVTLLLAMARNVLGGGEA